MNTLFEDRGNTAIFSPDRRHRLALFRTWGDSPAYNNRIMYIGLNPSKADESKNDNTIRRLIGFSKKFGYSSMVMCNVFSFVSTYPDLIEYDPESMKDNLIEIYNQSRNCICTVFCWSGLHKKIIDASGMYIRLIEMFPKAMCFGKNADGSPKHPLYLPKTCNLQPFKP